MSDLGDGESPDPGDEGAYVPTDQEFQDSDGEPTEGPLALGGSDISDDPTEESESLITPWGKTVATLAALGAIGEILLARRWGLSPNALTIGGNALAYAGVVGLYNWLDRDSRIHPEDRLLVTGVALAALAVASVIPPSLGLASNKAADIFKSDETSEEATDEDGNIITLGEDIGFDERPIRSVWEAAVFLSEFNEEGTTDIWVQLMEANGLDLDDPARDMQPGTELEIPPRFEVYEVQPPITTTTSPAATGN